MPSGHWRDKFSVIGFLLFTAMSTCDFFGFCLFVFYFCLCYPRYLTKLHSSLKHLAKSYYDISLNLISLWCTSVQLLTCPFSSKTGLQWFLVPSISLTEAFCLLVWGGHPRIVLLVSPGAWLRFFLGNTASWAVFSVLASWYGFQYIKDIWQVYF